MVTTDDKAGEGGEVVPESGEVPDVMRFGVDGEFDRDAYAVAVLRAMPLQELHKVCELGTTEAGGGLHADIVRGLARDLRAEYRGGRVWGDRAVLIAETIGENRAASNEHEQPWREAFAVRGAISNLRLGGVEDPGDVPVQQGAKFTTALISALGVAYSQAVMRLIGHVDALVEDADSEWTDREEAGQGTTDTTDTGRA